MTVLMALLGCLSVGIAGWFGGAVALDGPGWKQRLGGGVVAFSGLFGCVFLWSWGLYGYPLAVFDRGARFWDTFWPLAAGV